MQKVPAECQSHRVGCESLTLMGKRVHVPQKSWGGGRAASEHTGLGSHSPDANSSCTCYGLGPVTPSLNLSYSFGNWESICGPLILSVGEVLGLVGAVLILSKHKRQNQAGITREEKVAVVFPFVLFSVEKHQASSVRQPSALWCRTGSCM